MSSKNKPKPVTKELGAANGEPLLLTPRAARAALSISSTTEHRLNVAGHLKPLYIGKTKRYRSADIRALVAGEKEVA